MTSKEMNERITRVGPGTPMGDLLRRYWMPIAMSSELGPEPVAKRLLGEDLVVFRDSQGRVGVLEQACPHRGTSLAYGMCEADGLRCCYHGWLFDVEGNCLEQPAEPPRSKFKARVTARSYRAEELGGLVFAYMGPEPAPLLPRFDLFVCDNVYREIGHAVLPLNWLQAMENSVDPHHVEYLHGKYLQHQMILKGEEPPRLYAKRHLKVGFDVFEWGIIKRRVIEGTTEEDDEWRIGHPLVFPHMLRVGFAWKQAFQIRVPVDDTHTWHLWYTVYRPPSNEYRLEPQDNVPQFEVQVFAADGRFIDDYVDGQDVMAWASGGAIVDRTKEHLGTSDVGVIKLRRLFQEQMDLVAKGQDPLGVVRDPAKNVMIHLPEPSKKLGVAGGAGYWRENAAHGILRFNPQKNKIIKMYEEFERIELGTRAAAES